MPEPGTAQQRASGPAAPLPRGDALLQAARRLDWRFLLPSPDLGSVLYCGPARGSLPDALRLLSASLTVADLPPPQNIDAAPFDVVVLCQPACGALRAAAKLLKPQGFLYIELRRSGLRGGADYLRELERLGFAEAAAYWHWPNFESCTQIIPLDDGTAVWYALRPRRRGATARLAAALGRGLLRLGLLPRLLPCFSVVARREELP